uniref:Uncharacterized protein n=1 Tax=Varanus komodoensis TaxID=61221 RepID=A0A8D2KX67_VARKO
MEFVLPLQALELAEGRVRGLAQQQGHGAGLLRLGEEDGVAAQHHRLVLDLVPVDPRKDLGVPPVGHAVGDAVQQVGVAGPLARRPPCLPDHAPRLAAPRCLRTRPVCVCRKGAARAN